jgi:hypothetical protein
MGMIDANPRCQRCVKLAAHAAEAVLLRGFLSEVGELGEPLTRGELAPLFWGSVATTVSGSLLSLLPLPGRLGSVASTVGSLLGMAGGFALRWAMVYAGHPSADDPEAARKASRDGR